MERTLEALEALAGGLAAASSILVLTGAGISAPSGIPTYRNHAGAWQRSIPIQHQEFMQSEAVRRRYWARSLVGWPLVEAAQPNAAHLAIAQLEQRLPIQCLVTQNVDGLHQRAGSKNLIDLHGRLGDVRCMRCGAISDRGDWQPWLMAHNPSLANYLAEAGPDGDARLEIDFSEVEIPICPECGGILKPDVVFYGDTVPPERADAVKAASEQCDSLWVIGSSLQVFSGYRICLHAHKRNIPIFVLNQGDTRATSITTLQIRAPCETALPALAELL